MSVQKIFSRYASKCDSADSIAGAKLNIKNSAQGFTLVEMIIYIAFFAVLSVSTVNATLLVMKSFYTLRISQNMNQSATTALERMSREIRNAYDVDTMNSTFGTNPGRLTLKTKDSLGANTTVEFYVDSANQLNMRIGGVEQGLLVSSSVSLTNLVFHLITTTNSKAIKIDMILHDARSGVTKTANFYDTIVLRGSLH